MRIGKEGAVGLGKPLDLEENQSEGNGHNKRSNKSFGGAMGEGQGEKGNTVSGGDRVVCTCGKGAG